MRGFTPIRITQNDRKEYAKLVRNTKAKIRRTSKNYGVDLSGEIELPPIENFSTRKEFNEWKQKQSSFTNRANRNYQFVKNKYGVVANKKEIDEAKRATKLAQKRADKIIKDAEKKPFISGGKQQGTVGQRMLQMQRPNAAGINKPPDFDFNKINTRKRFEDKLENMEKRAKPDYYDKRKEQMKENFKEILSLSLNSDADKLVDKIDNLSAEVFYEMYLMFDEFDFDLWDSEGQLPFGQSEAQSHVSQMMSYIERYERGDMNFDLKDF